MIGIRNIGDRDIITVECREDIMMSTFTVEPTGEQLLTFTDEVDRFKNEEGILDMEDSYEHVDESFESINPKVMISFTNPRSVRNMIGLLERLESKLVAKEKT